MVNYLKSFSILLVLLLLSEGQAQTGRDSMATLDAIILTLRLQQGIKLDTLLAREIDQALEAARTLLDTV
ncbi:MAG: hypothetical protein ONB05_03950, partial [candidate division KSB1 bacterium]|nr:hypothetical protein [candidate division KSB1 bacterium]